VRRDAYEVCVRSPFSVAVTAGGGLCGRELVLFAGRVHRGFWLGFTTSVGQRLSYGCQGRAMKKQSLTSRRKNGSRYASVVASCYFLWPS
jgi:hypothetical protein